MQIKLFTPLNLPMCLTICSLIQTHESNLCTISIQNSLCTVTREIVLDHSLKPILLQITNCRQSWFSCKPLRVKTTQTKIVQILSEQYRLCLMRVTMHWFAFFNISISSKSRHNVPLRVIPIIVNPSFFKAGSSFPVISLSTKTFTTSSEVSSILFAHQNTSPCVHSFTHGAFHPFSVHFKLSNYSAKTEYLAVHIVKYFAAIIVPLTLNTTPFFT